MFKPNESFLTSSLVSARTQKDLIDLIDQTNDNNVKRQYNRNELFQAEHDLKDYVTNLKKKSILILDDDSKVKIFQRPRKKKDGLGGTIKNTKMKKEKSGFKKNADIQRRMSYNLFKVNSIYQNDNNDYNNNNTIENEIESENDNTDDNDENENSNIYNNSYITYNKHNNSNKIDSSFNTYSYQKSFDKKFTFYKKKKMHSYEKKKNKNQLSRPPSYIKKTLSKKPTINKILLEEEMEPMKYSSINKSFSFFKLPEIFNGENDSKSIENNSRFLKVTYLSSKNILELNEIKKEFKKSIVGQNIVIDIDPAKTYLMDEEIIESKTIHSVDENEKEKYRILTRKGYVYDSFDDEENIDEINYNFIHPESNIIFYFDLFVFIFAFYNLIYVPLFLATDDVYCINHKFHFNFYINIIIDFVYIIDVIISFFIAYYNFDEILIIAPKLIIKNYLKTWFLIDLISAIPFQTFLTIFNNKCKNEAFLQKPLYGNHYYYLLILYRLFKIFHVITKNKFKEKISNEISQFTLFHSYGNFLIHLFAFFLSLHIVACVFIFIGKNDYPNWIVNFNYNNKSFKELYLIAIYYTITTLTTVGYGDISCVSSNERIFGIFLEVIGICTYSWALTEISNYIKVLNEKTEELSNKIQILDDIKLNYPRLPDDLYDRIVRYLRYQHYYEKKDKNIIIEALPIGLRNTLIYEMYKPVINNFTFFKDFTNTDFIVKVIVAFKPILSLKNDILIKDGDLVEDIIFVKRGRLSLEIPFYLIKPKKSKTHVKRNSINMRRSTLFFNNITRDNSMNNNVFCFSPTNNNMNISFLNNNTTENNTIDDKKEEENMQYYKILEIRRNEHFGDILMFLNQRSPLCLRVKTKKAELFFLNKEDAINISTSYPQYWKTINKKSLFNMQQIKRLINKIIKIISTEQDLNLTRRYSKTNDEYANLKSIYEDDLQTIPSFSHESDISEDENENESAHKSENNDKEYEHYYDSINNLHHEKTNDINQNDDVLKTILEDNFKEFQSSNENKSLLSEEKHDKETLNNLDSVINFKNSTYKIKTFKTSLTPYKDDEINDEIYPEETFIISPQSNPNYQFTYNHNHLNKNNLDNISICSTEISFSINSEYENIDELSEGNYSKDVSFRTTIKNFIQEEVKKKNNYKINLISNEENDINSITNYNNFTNIHNKNTFDLNIKKKGSYLPRRSSNFSLNQIKQSKTKNNFLKIKSKDFMSNKTLVKVDEDENKTKKNKRMLSVISENIEKNKMNLNNPELFYSEVFMKFMDRKMTKIKENDPNIEINKEEKDFIRRVTSISSMKYEFNKTFNTLKNKI